MLDAQGVSFAARRATKTSGISVKKLPLVSFLGAEIEFTPTEVKDLGALIELFGENNIGPRPNPQSAREDPPILYNPKKTGWHVRDQGKERGTCVAFAALAGLELHKIRQSKEPDADHNYSEEFVYSHARDTFITYGPGKKPEMERTGAIYLQQVAKVLIGCGIAKEDSLPYRYVKDDPAWIAEISDEVTKEALKNRLDEKDVFVALDLPEPAEGIGEPRGDFPKGMVVEFILSNLNIGLATSITLPVYSTGRHSPWTVGNAWKTGIIPDPTMAAKAAGSKTVGHAICIIGMIPDPDAPDDETKGWFIFRNSWGTRFGYKRPRHPKFDAVLAPGYGAISFDHVEDECWGLMTLFPAK